MPNPQTFTRAHANLLSCLKLFLPAFFVPLAVGYAKTTFKKTKTSSHLSFLKQRLRLRVITGGFLLHYSPSDPNNSSLTVSIIIINPLTARVVGAPQMILQPVSSIFPCFPLPSGTCRTPGLSIPWCCLPTSSFSSSLFHCALQDGFGQTWWTGNMTIPLQCASIYDRQEIFMWSNCLLDLGTDFLVGNMVFVWDV